MTKTTDPTQGFEPVATKNAKGLTLHAGWDDLPAESALYTADQLHAAQVKEGWQLVPILPDVAMRIAGGSAASESMGLCAKTSHEPKVVESL